MLATGEYSLQSKGVGIEDESLVHDKAPGADTSDPSRRLCCENCTPAKVISVIVMIMALCVGLPALLWWMHLSDSTETGSYLLVISSFFVAAAVPYSFYTVYKHQTNYWQPMLQR
mmetsp:Transcript_86106/g.243223  ORF Transcript_86106/g.243223 Transcript_86106/m.243223 type:complete len:115 (+) Transcript_86106:117-461(+)